MGGKLRNGNKPHDLTTEERRRGAENANKTHARRKSLAELVDVIANSRVSKETAKKLKASGIDVTEDLTKRAKIGLNIVEGAMANDHKSIDEFMTLTGEKIERQETTTYNVEMPIIDLGLEDEADEVTEES